MRKRMRYTCWQEEEKTEDVEEQNFLLQYFMEWKKGQVKRKLKKKRENYKDEGAKHDSKWLSNDCVI